MCIRCRLSARATHVLPEILAYAFSLKGGDDPPLVRPMLFEIDEDLWFSTKANKLAEQRAAESMAALSGKVFGAKPFPVAAQKLAALTANADFSVDQAVSILETDPALSASLLRVVNSAAYGLRGRCSSLRQAVTLVGSSKLRQLSTTAAVLDMFGGSGALAVSVLEHGTAVGAVCRYLAPHFSLPADEMFMCGFLHDLGKLMMLDGGMEDYARLLEQHSGKFDALHQEERGVYGFDHGVLAAHIFTAWNIPAPICRVVGWHHQPARAYKEKDITTQMVAGLRLADEIADVLLSDHRDDPSIVEALGTSEGAVVLGVSPTHLAAMWRDLRRVVGIAPPSEDSTPSHSLPKPAAAPPKIELDDGSTPSAFELDDSGAPLSNIELAPRILHKEEPSQGSSGSLPSIPPLAVVATTPTPPRMSDPVAQPPNAIRSSTPRLLAIPLCVAMAGCGGVQLATGNVVLSLATAVVAGVACFLGMRGMRRPAKEGLAAAQKNVN